MIFYTGFLIFFIFFTSGFLQVTKSWLQPGFKWAVNRRHSLHMELSTTSNNPIEAKGYQTKDKRKQDTNQLIENMKASLKSNKIVDFTVHLKDLAAQNRFRLNYVQSIDPIFSEFLKNGSKLSDRTLCDMLWSLSRLGYSFNQNQGKTTCVTLIDLFVERRIENHRLFTMGFIGISKLGVKIPDFSAEAYEILQDTIVKVTANIDNQGVANLIYSLGTMRANWNEMKYLLTFQLKKSYKLNANKMVSQGSANSLYGFGLLNLKYSSLDRDFQFLLQQQVNRSISQMSPQGVANTVYGIGLMDFPWRRMHPSVRSSVQDVLLSTVVNMTAQGVSSTFYGLGQMGVSWFDIRQDYSKSFEKAVVSTVGNVNEQGIANIIYSMGKMGAQWAELEDKTQYVLQRQVHKMVQTMTPQGLSNTLYGLGILNTSFCDSPSCYCCCRDFTQPAEIEGLKEGRRGDYVHRVGEEMCLSSIESALRNSAPLMKAQEVANTIYSLGKMSAEYENLQNDTKEVIWTAVRKTFSSMKPQEASNTLYGLGLMGFSPKSQQALVYSENGFLKSSGGFYPQDYFKTKMSTGLSDLLPVLSLLVGNMTEQGLSNTLYGLSLMGSNWVSLGRGFHSAVQQALKTDPVEMTPYGVANSLYGLALLEVSWKDLPPGFRERLEGPIFKFMHRVNEQSLAKTMYSLALMDASWTSLSIKTQLALCSAINRTSSSMVTQEVSNIMYSLSVLSFDVNYNVSYDFMDKEEKTDISLKIDNSSRQKRSRGFESLMLLWYVHCKTVEAASNCLQLIDDFDEQQKTQFAIYFNFMNSIPNGRKLVKEIIGYTPNISVPTGELTGSKFHSRVAQTLLRHLDTASSGNFRIENEFFGLQQGLFPIDAALFYKDQLVAFIEVDGDSHYLMNTEGQQHLRRIDQLKEHLYKSKYPSILIHRVRYIQTQRYGMESVCKELALKVLFSAVKAFGA